MKRLFVQQIVCVDDTRYLNNKVMKISTRAQNMPESPIRKLAKYADAAKRNGVHIYHLNTRSAKAVLYHEYVQQRQRNVFPG